MEISNYFSSMVVGGVAVAVFCWAIGSVLNWVWLRPKRLETHLRKQGFSGNSYRFLYGDLKDSSSLIRQAKSSPIGVDDDIVPRVLPFIHNSVSTYGKNSFMWFGPRPRLNISDPELVKEILTKIYTFQKPKSNPLARLLTTGLVQYEDEQWAKHRKLLNPAFHMEKLKNMLPAFHLSCSEMVTKWEKMVPAQGSTSEVDVWPHLQTMTSDVISRTAFGSNYEEGRKVFKLQTEQADLTMQMFQSVYIPGSRFLPTKINKRMKAIDSELKSSLTSLINRRMKEMKAGESGKNDDLLGILLESNMREIEKNGNDNKAGMSIAEVIDECKVFYFAGQETTSTLLVWTLVLLSRHQIWQRRAREEVLEVFGDQEPRIDGLTHLKTVTMILNEVLRLYPPVVMMTRTVHKDTKVGKLSIPAGTMLALPTLLLQHDTDIWGDDAKEFKPERFSEGISKAVKKQVSYFPFSWGPRVCIGQNFAMLEAKMAMAMILQRFSFELSPSYAHAPFTVITLQPQYGAHLILHKL